MMYLLVGKRRVDVEVEEVEVLVVGFVDDMWTVELLEEGVHRMLALLGILHHCFHTNVE